MDATRVRSFRLMNVEECLNLLEHALEIARLIAAGRFDCIAVHGIARPHHNSPLALDCTNQLGQHLRRLVGTEAANESKPPWCVFRIENINEAQQFILIQSGATLQTEWILDASCELDMSVVDAACAVAEPQKMRRSVEPFAVAIGASERLLVPQK